MAGSRISQIPLQALKIVGNAAKQTFLDDYSSNVSQLVTDSKEVLNTISLGKTKVVDIVSDIKQNGGKKIADWFFDGGLATDEFDLMGNGESDFDAGYQLGEGEDGSEAPTPSKILDSDNMKDIARGQVNAMYKIAGKQAEASMVNAAEITSSINARAAEMITAINNVNSSVIAISEKLDTLVQLQTASVKQEEEERKQAAQGVLGSDGRATLGSFTNYLKSSAKNLTDGPWKMFLQSMGPSELLSMFLFDPLRDKDLGNFANKFKRLQGTEFANSLQGSTWDSIGKEFNQVVGDVIHDTLTGQFESSFGNMLSKSLSKLPMGLGDMVLGTIKQGMGLKDGGLDSYKSEVKSIYNNDKAIFDGKVYQSIVTIIPDYLKHIAHALTGKDLRVDTKSGQLTTEKYNVGDNTDYRMMYGNIIRSNEGGSKIIENVNNKMNSIITDPNNKKSFENHKDDLYELFTMAATWFFVDNHYVVTGIKDLKGDDFWNYVTNFIIHEASGTLPWLNEIGSNAINQFINNIKHEVLSQSSTVFGHNTFIHNLANDISRRVRDLKESNYNRTKDQVENGYAPTNINHAETLQAFEKTGTQRANENKYYELERGVREQVEQSQEYQNALNKPRAERDRIYQKEYDRYSSLVNLQEFRKEIDESYDKTTARITALGENQDTVSKNIESFKTGVFDRLDKILHKIPNPNNAFGSGDIPPLIFGSGNNGDQDSDTISDADRILIESANAMTQAVSQDGELKEDLPLIKRAFGMVKNKNISKKLSDMWSNVGNHMKSKVNDVKNNGGILGTLKSFFSGGLLGIGVKLIKTLGSLFITAVAKPFLNLMKKGIMSGAKDIKTGFGDLFTNMKNKFAERQAAKEAKANSAGALTSSMSAGANIKPGGDSGASKLNMNAASTADSVGLTNTDGSPVAKTEYSQGEAGSGVGTPKQDTGTANAASNAVSGAANASTVSTVTQAAGKSAKGISGFISKITSSFSKMLSAHPIVRILLGVAKILGTIVLGMSAVKSFMKLISKTITNNLKPLQKGIKTIIKTVTPLVKKLGAIIGKLAEGISAIVEAVSGLLDTLVNTVGKILDGIMNLLTPVLNVLTGILSAVTKILEPILEAITNIISPIFEAVYAALEIIVDIINVLSPIFETVGDMLTELFVPLYQEYIQFMTDIWMTWLSPLVDVMNQYLMPALKIYVGATQVFFSNVLTGIANIIELVGNILKGVGEIAKNSSLQITGDDMLVRARRYRKKADDYSAKGINTMINGASELGVGEGKTAEEAASSSTGHTATPAVVTGASIDTFGSGPGDTSTDNAIVEGIYALNLAFDKFTDSYAESATEIKTIRGVMPKIVNALFDDIKANKEISKKTGKVNSAVRNIVAPTADDINNNIESMSGSLGSLGAQILAAQGLQLMAAGQTDAGNAIYQTAAGEAATALVRQNQAAIGKANSFVRRAGLGSGFSLESLYADSDTGSTDDTGTPEGVLSKLQISEDEFTPSDTNSPSTSTFDVVDFAPSETNTPSVSALPGSDVFEDNSERYYYWITGSGNSQGSYGSYMNMTQRGCGPVALADAYMRRGGGNVNAASLASGMSKSGAYSTSKGTSVGGFLNTAQSMGMGYKVGGVSQGSLKNATPDNPITLVGSGNGYGTKSGNTHYVNVIGTDGGGNAFVSNPISGRVERRSSNDLVAGSLLGLYGSGPGDQTDADLYQNLIDSGNLDIAAKGTSTKSNNDKINLNDVRNLTSQLKSKYPKLYKQLQTAYSIDCKNNGTTTTFENWLRAKIPSSVNRSNMTGIVTMLKEMTNGIIISDGQSVDTSVSTEIAEAEALDSFDTVDTSSSVPTLGTSSGGISNNYVGNNARHTSSDTSYSSSSTSSGSSFEDVFKSAMSGLSSIFTNILNLFSFETDEDDTQAELDKQTELEAYLRKTLGNEEYESYEEAAFKNYQNAHPRGKKETVTEYKIRLRNDWMDDDIKRKWMNEAAQNNGAVINAAKANDSYDAANQTDSTIWGDYDPETGQWTGGLGNGTSSSASTIGGGSVEGGSTEEQVWSYMTKVLGFTPEGAAGVMGNMNHESAFRANNLEDIFNKSLGMSDEEYTSAVDNGSYSRDKFISDHTKKGCGAGYGLVQFTAAELKSKLYDLAKSNNKSISDVGVQLDAVAATVSPDIISKLKSTNSVQEASDLWLTGYEKPKNMNAQKATRGKESQTYYDKYKNWDGSGVTVTNGSGTTSGTSYVNTPTSATGTGGSNQAKIDTTKLKAAMPAGTVDTWLKYKDKKGITDYFTAAAQSRLSPAQRALLMSTGIWEDSGRKLLGQKDLTAITKDKNGQLAVGLMNWIPKNIQGGRDTSYGSTLSEQLDYIYGSYFSDNPSYSRGFVNGSNFSKYRNVINSLTGHDPIGKTGDPIGPIIDKDLIEGGIHYVGGSLVPEGWNGVPTEAKYVGTAADIYNWMIDNGMATPGASGSSGSIGGGTGVGKYDTAYDHSADMYGVGGSTNRGGFANYAFSSINGINNRYSGGSGISGGVSNGNVGGWIDALNAAVIQTDKLSKHTYDNSHSIYKMTLNGKEIRGKMDCTGMIQYPLDYLGYGIDNIQSNALVKSCNASEHPIKLADGSSSADFTAYKWGSQVSAADVQPGDILVRDGHGEIGIGQSNGRLYGWNFGANDAIVRTQKMAYDMVNNGMSPMDAAIKEHQTLQNKPYAYLIRPNIGNSAVSTVSSVTGSGDIPDIDLNRIIGTDDNRGNTTNNFIVTRATTENDELMTKLNAMTFSVRDERVAELLTEILELMNEIKDGKDNGSNGGSITPREPKSSPFDNNIPSQIQRLAIG